MFFFCLFVFKLDIFCTGAYLYPPPPHTHSLLCFLLPHSSALLHERFLNCIFDLFCFVIPLSPFHFIIPPSKSQLRPGSIPFFQEKDIEMATYSPSIHLGEIFKKLLAHETIKIFKWKSTMCHDVNMMEIRAS